MRTLRIFSALLDFKAERAAAWSWSLFFFRGSMCDGGVCSVLIARLMRKWVEVEEWVSGDVTVWPIVGPTARQVATRLCCCQVDHFSHGTDYSAWGSFKSMFFCFSFWFFFFKTGNLLFLASKSYFLPCFIYRSWTVATQQDTTNGFHVLYWFFKQTHRVDDQFNQLAVFFKARILRVQLLHCGDLLVFCVFFTSFLGNELLIWPNKTSDQESTCVFPSGPITILIFSHQGDG